MAKHACNQAGWMAANESLHWMIAGGSLKVVKNRIAEGVFGRSFFQRPA